MRAHARRRRTLPAQPCILTPTFPWYCPIAAPFTATLGLWSPFALIAEGFLLHSFHTGAPGFLARWPLLKGLALLAAARRLDLVPRGKGAMPRDEARAGDATAAVADAATPASPVVDPRRYHEAADPNRSSVAVRPPVCLYLEVTNRCNLLCTTCPRTYVELEPPADLSWDLFTRIVDQIPDLKRAVMHGVGEPMLVKDLPRMVRYLKERGTYVLFNTNGTVLNERNGRALVEAGLDELRVSLDASTRESYLAVRGVDYFERILRNVARFRAMQEREGFAKPRVSAWLTGLKDTVAELPAFVRLAADIGVREVYLQRLVFFEEGAIGKARPDQALFESLAAGEAEHIAEAERVAAELGLTFSASGAASEPGLSLERKASSNPWSLCGRPWTVMYFTANGRALPCCIAPFAQAGYENYTLGDATQETLREIWNGARYRDFRTALQSDRPPSACANCGLRWSL